MEYITLAGLNYDLNLPIPITLHKVVYCVAGLKKTKERIVV